MLGLLYDVDAPPVIQRVVNSKNSLIGGQNGVLTACITLDI